MAIALALAAAPCLSAEWEKTYDWSSAFQVQLSAVVASPSDPHRVYAFAGNTPWLLYSDDAGLSWDKTTPVVPRGGVTDIAVDPLGSGTIYATVSSFSSALYKSIDGGKSFTPLDAATFVASGVHVAIDPRVPTTLYATRPVICTVAVCTQGGIVKSIDGGLNWFQTGRVDSANGRPVIDPINPLIVYTLGVDLPLSRQTGGLYRTLDSGITWPSMFPGLTSAFYLTVDNRSRVYAIAQQMFETLLLRSTNHGELWSRLPVNPVFQLSAVVPDPRRPETLYVSSLTNAAESDPSVKNPGVLVSYDDGATWLPLGDFPDRTVNTIALTPDGVVLAAARTGIWRYVTPPPPPPRRRAVAAHGAR